MKFKKILKKVMIFSLIYVLLFGLFIFKMPYAKSSNITYDIDEIKTVQEEKTYAYIIEDIPTALAMRISLIESAEETIDIAYYTITSGKAADIFYGALLKKANEGVRIRIIVDGLFFPSNKKDFKAVASHPNITYALYDPFNLFSFYGIHNTLHDKLIIIDNKYGLIGGRNITDRFLIQDPSKQLAYDRDVLLITNNQENSVVTQMQNYYDELFNLDFNKVKNVKNHQKYQSEVQRLAESFLSYCNTLNDFENYLTNQLDNKIPIDNATFVRDPLNRLNKEPLILNTLYELSQDYDDIFVQSPYITSSRMLKKNFIFSDDTNITILTNNLTTNPNLLASSGYIRIRKNLAKNTTLYEFQHENSLHAKTFTMGKDISIIGSINMDHRSVYLSTESVVVIYSEEFQNALNDNLKILLNQSLEVNESGNYINDENVEAIKQSKSKITFTKIVSYLTSLISEML